MSSNERPIGNPLGWVLAALSILGMLDDLSWIRLSGQIKEWVNAYGNLVAKVSEFLFGWIDFLWFRVSELEAHVAVVAIIFGSALGRAEVREPSTHRPAYEDPSLKGKLLTYLSTFWGPAFMVLAIEIAYPPPFGLIVGSGILILVVLASTIGNSVSRKGGPSGRTVRQELIGTLAVVLLIVAVDHVLARR